MLNQRLGPKFLNVGIWPIEQSGIVDLLSDAEATAVILRCQRSQ